MQSTVLKLIYVNGLLNCIFFVQQAVIFYLSLTSQYIVVLICSDVYSCYESEHFTDFVIKIHRVLSRLQNMYNEYITDRASCTKCSNSSIISSRDDMLQNALSYQMLALRPQKEMLQQNVPVVL